MKILALCVAALLLSSCASYSGRGLVPGQSSAKDVETVMGAPKERITIAGGDSVWFYPRNPFGLEAVEGGLYSAENGINMDRFVQVERGQDYLWNGSDESIATGADALFIPAISPVHVAALIVFGSPVSNTSSPGCR